MNISCTEQQQIIVTFYEIGGTDLTDRLDRCMTERRQRHYGDRRPYSC